MIVNDRSINIVYRCPDCGQNVRGVIGFFSFSGDMIRLKCPCGGSTLTVAKARDGMVRIEVPCIICPKPHIFTVSEKLLFSGELFSFACTYTAINICFIGEPDKIEDAVNESDREFSELLEESGAEDLSLLHPDEEELIDGDTMQEIYEVESIVNFMICELSEEGRIHCGCEERGEYRFELVPPEYDEARIYCESCGKELILPMKSLRDAEEFITQDEITLE